MEIQYYGGNCIKIVSKKSSIVIDDTLKELGQQPIVTDKDIALFTNSRHTPPKATYFTIDGPGEYEVADISIQGIAARGHMDEDKARNVTMYRVIMEDLRIAAVGHIHPDLTERDMESIGTVDILFVPVGGSGYTLDPIGAQKVIKELEPKVVIPTHYADKGLKYEVPQADLETAIKGLGMEPAETVETLKIKQLDLSATDTKLIVLQRK